ncbi:MAG: energy-coupling factor transporter transmembrane protein EcfT [Desulfuromonadales bacterium]|nr:energy-coupling factor transporter transmembrane protein EcfT [Desulfuromonadales bacterium]NIR34026.1 energy-coupling factor transporter transmembrane protein EcfT [Desulfuromonadales bacterium]NIS44077.1 energy-coupling factor transporter transmembrane protein EcfT [Desulfuromonadales bacterium]
MSLIEALSLGQFRPGNTPMHRLSPGLKLVALPACVIASFALTGPVQLTGLALWALALTVVAGQTERVWKFGLWQLRYLFVVTIVLHAVLSPGRTLFGLTWLSLDGSLLGLRIAGQLAMAVTFSSLLTLTTGPADLVDSLEKLLSPFASRWSWPREVILFLSLILYFIPVLREEAARVVSRSGDDGPHRKSLLSRAMAGAELVQPLLFSLVDRADDLAGRLAAGESLFGSAQALESRRYSLTVQVLVACAWALLIVVVVGGLS